MRFGRCAWKITRLIHSYTAPGFAWQAALRMTDVSLELISDKDMYTFCEAGKRGGVSVITQRFAKANNPTAPDYDSSKPSTSLMYLDMNNLYGAGMVEALPIGEFEWTDMPLRDILTTADDADYGTFVEVDLHYPNHLHDPHNDYPLAPEKIQPPSLSPFQKNLLHTQYKINHPTWSDAYIMHNIDTFTHPKKLSPNLQDKTKYIVHYRLLKYYLSKGMLVTKVHRALRFRQVAWLKPFIDFNMKMRQEATSEFAKDFFKLLNNSVFGKTMENTRDYRHVDLVGTEKQALKLAAQPTYRSFNIFHENLFAVERYKALVHMDKPIYTGVSVLELSKLFMYKFHYDYIKNKYPDGKSKLCFTDTDSLLYEIETDDIYDDMLENHELFDFSDYPNNHPMFDGKSEDETKWMKQKNKKVIGKMKDELHGKTMIEFAGTKAKAYSYTYEDFIYLDNNGEEVEDVTDNKNSVLIEEQKLKGIKKCVVKNKINHNHYKSCVLDGRRLYERMTTFRSCDHKICTITQSKLALSCYDDKRWIQDDGVSTLAHGHWRTHNNPVEFMDWQQTFL